MHERPILRSLLRTAQQQPCRRALSTSKAVPSRTHLRSQALRASCRPLSTTASRRIDITEGADSKTTKKSEPHWKPTAPTPISDEKYQEQSDHYFERLLEQLEMLQEEKGDMDVEYSQGVMTIVVPPMGTYIVNKQPFNKQIWLSAPESGPKRYDWVVPGEGMDEKGGTGLGEWVYMRDGTTLTQLLEKELRVKMDPRE